MKTIILVFLVYACLGFTDAAKAAPQESSAENFAKRKLIELKIDLNEPFTKEMDRERVGVHFVLINKSKQDLYLGYRWQATVSLYAVNDEGKRTRVWLPPGTSNDGSVRSDIIKAGESESFVNPVEPKVLMGVAGKPVIASVRVCSPGDTENSEVFSDIFKMPSLPVDISK